MRVQRWRDCGRSRRSGQRERVRIRVRYRRGADGQFKTSGQTGGRLAEIVLASRLLGKNDL